MGPLDFLKQKLQQGLSTVENWGSDAGNDITHAVGALFGTNAPQPKQPTVVQQPQTNRSALPPQLQPQNQPANPAQQQLPKPIQLQDQQPNSVPLSNFSAPKPTNNAIKIAQPTAQVAPPRVAPVKIANNQPSPFVQKLVSGQLKPNTPQKPYKPSAVDETVANIAKFPFEFVAGTAKSLTIDPAQAAMAAINGDREGLKRALNTEVQDNPFHYVMPLGNRIASKISEGSVEQAADKSAQQITQTLLESPYGKTAAGRAYAEAAGSAAREEMLDRLLAGVGEDENTSRIKEALMTGGDILGASTPLALADLPGLAAGAVSRGSEALSGAAKIESAAQPGEAVSGAASAVEPPSGALDDALARGGQLETKSNLEQTPPELQEKLQEQRAGGMPAQSNPQLETSERQLGKTLENSTTNPENVNEGFPARDLQAETAAYETYTATGDLQKAVKAYQNASGTDSMTALSATSRALQEAGKLPYGEDDITKIMSPVEVPKKVPPKTAQALKDLADTYKQRIHNPADAEDLLRKAGGLSEEFKLRSAALEKAMSEEFTPQERQAIRDSLEGSARPEEVTPKVEAVVKPLSEFNEKGLNTLQVARPDVRSVANYATRLYRGPKLLEESSRPLSVKFGQLSDLFDTRSRFGEGRQIQKFVAKDGEARYGTQNSLGLRNIKGELRDSAGKVFKPAATTTRELTEAGKLNFERDYGKIAGEYHSDIGKVAARYQALQELLGNTTKYGISDIPENGLVEIRGVPELAGKYAPPKVAKSIMDYFRAPDVRGPVERVYSGLSNIVTQFIVYNPLFHGRNLDQLAGMAAGKVSPLGPLELKLSQARLAFGGAGYRSELLTRFLRAGGGLEHYGSENRTVLTDALDKMNLPHFNKANSVAMSRIDTFERLSLFDQLTHRGMDDSVAVREVDRFLGDRKAGNQIARDIGMFWNYNRTQLRAAAELRHPGVALSFAEQAAIHFGVQKAFQEWTGNKHASIGNPGEFGLINTANELRQGDLGAVASTKVNPIVSAGLNQIYGKDMYSGNPLNTGQERIQNAIDTLVAPTQLTSKIANGNSSIPQVVTQGLTGLNLPHTKGTPAIPNENNPLASVINLPGSKAATGADATGIDQATMYYHSKDALTSSLQGDQPALDAANKFLDREKTPQGQTILSGPQQTASNWSDLASQPKALLATQKMQQSLPSHNPEWDLPSSELATWAVYKSLPPGDLQRDVMLQKNPWISDLESKISAWGQQQVQSGNTVQSPDYVAYPTLSPDVQQMMNRASQLGGIPPENRTPAEEQELKNLSNNPDLQAAYQQLDQYTNAVRSKWGLPQIQYAPTASPEVQNFTNVYMSADKATRTQLRTQSPELFNQMQTFLAQQSLANVEKKGGEAYYGAPVGGSLLGSIYNLGQYDINRTVNSNGTSSYSINPQAAYASKAAASGSSKKPLVPLPKRPKKNEARVLKLRKSRMSHKVHISKSPRIHIKKSQVLKPVHVGHAGPLKIAK